MQYFSPFLNIFECEEIADLFIEDIGNYDGYFPNMEWEICGEIATWCGGARPVLDHRLNQLYRGELLNYLGCENATNRFVEGNVYLLSKKVVERLFGDKVLYNSLNSPGDFDYNWVCKEYGLGGSIRGVHRACTARGLPLHSKLRDACIEHAFERVVVNLCSRTQILSMCQFDIKKYIKSIF